jgi:23S rRNA (guanosine2251-2'-O)-methyltransferase
MTGNRRPVRTTDHGPRTTGVGSEWVVGFHAVLGALQHDRDRVEVVWMAEGLSGSRARDLIEAARAAGVRYASVPRKKLDALSGDLAHNGVAARLAPVPYVGAEELLASAGPVCLLGLDGLEDAHNLGAVVRTAAALALGGVVVAGPHPPPLGGGAAKVAAGTLPLVRVAHVGALGDFATAAKGAGFWILGADPGGRPVGEAELPERLLLCLGGEAVGLRAKTRRALDGTVAIPLAAGVESLNLSVAAGILAWEWRRRYPGSGHRAPSGRGPELGVPRRSPEP